MTSITPKLWCMSCCSCSSERSRVLLSFSLLLSWSMSAFWEVVIAHFFHLAGLNPFRVKEWFCLTVFHQIQGSICNQLPQGLLWGCNGIMAVLAERNILNKLSKALVFWFLNNAVFCNSCGYLCSEVWLNQLLFPNIFSSWHLFLLS